jgi:hypothetical protein
VGGRGGDDVFLSCGGRDGRTTGILAYLGCYHYLIIYNTLEMLFVVPLYFAMYPFTLPFVVLLSISVCFIMTSPQKV